MVRAPTGAEGWDSMADQDGPNAEELARFARFLEGWSRRDFRTRTGAAAAFAAFVAACGPTAVTPAAGGSGAPTIAPIKGGTITEGNSLPVIEFNPVNKTNTPHNINVPLVLDVMYAASPTGAIETRLASALPTISADGLTYTIPLRKNAQWSDGKPLTASDVAFTFALIIDPQYSAVVSAYRSDFKALIASVTASDPNTVVVKLKVPDAPFTSRLVNICIAPQQAYSGMTPAQIQAAFLEPPTVVSGVFKVVDWKRGDFVKYVRNDLHWDGPAYLDGYLYKVLPTTDALLNQLKTGEIDCARIPTPGVFDELKNTPSLGVSFIPATFIHGYCYQLDPAKPASN